MKNNIQMSIAILALVTALVIDQQVNAANDLVRQMCGRTDNNNLCVSIIEADPRENLKNSPNGLCGILRDRALSNAVATTPKISNLLKTTTNTYARECLQICLDSYEKSIMELKSVDFREINDRNYGSLVIKVSYGSLGPEDCEESFTERPGTPPSPLKPENNNQVKVVNLALEILNLTLQSKRPRKNSYRKNINYSYSITKITRFLHVMCSNRDIWVCHPRSITVGAR
ncbi:hypothetical protein ACJIZ3_009379 [Penstemon smallii]|uniref:Pectinesterase inhibitor domain-containing protein n=1 Tax=Penstemon smallii TaxID=265156 RepID=A0ABD3TE33_9LAMI